MTRFFAIFFSLVLCVSTFATQASEEIGLSLPFTGRGAAYAELVKSGAKLAVDQVQGLTLNVADDRCDPTTASAIASQFENAAIVIGPMCFETAKAIAAALNPADATDKRPLIALGTRNNLLARARQYSGLPIFALAKKTDAEAVAFIELGLPLFNGKPFAIVDDGSVHGRTLADDIRLLGEQKGFKPVILINYRPLRSNQRAMLRRLQRTGVEALIVSGEAEDVVTILRDMKALKLNWPVLIGEQASLLNHAQGAKEISKGVIVLRETLPPLNPDETIRQLLNQSEAPLNPAFLTGYTLAQIAIQHLQKPDASLLNHTFKTILGSYNFGPDGRAEFAPFRFFRWDGENFSPDES